ncbi:MAG: hypothetical protein NZ926_01530 [Candidatus Methanomethylicia archaeon]|nr:hypothetical protein [Candidatus Methanomethylicia archaeon]MCX8169106.1 hypothetical protein [Candidatus Methanomethylicia archaeon]MDW7988838.1 hypothetical protein [Nitrososphaerota archaeon]
MTKIAGIIVKNQRIKYLIMSYLNKYKVNFIEFSSIEEAMNKNVNVLFTDINVHSILFDDNLPNLNEKFKEIIVLNYDYDFIFSIKELIFKIFPHLFDKKMFNEVIVGIDPGKTYGLIVIADGKILFSQSSVDVDIIVSELMDTLNYIPFKRAIIRIGSGGGVYLKILESKLAKIMKYINPNIKHNISFEVINEFSLAGTNIKYHREKNDLSDDVFSAYIIAITKGKKMEVYNYINQ